MSAVTSRLAACRRDRWFRQFGPTWVRDRLRGRLGGVTGARGVLMDSGPGIDRTEFNGGADMQEKLVVGMPEVDAGEEALLRFYETGSDREFERFAAWAEGWLLCRARQLLRRCPGDRSTLASELVQSVLVKVARSRGRARWDPRRSSARTWLNRVLRNVLYSHWRSRWSRDARRQVSLTERSLSDALSRGCVESDAADSFLKEDECRQALRLMHELPDRYRHAVEQVVLEGRSHAEASRHLGVSAATVGRRVQKALKLLRNVCEGRCRAKPWGTAA